MASSTHLVAAKVAKKHKLKKILRIMILLHLEDKNQEMIRYIYIQSEFVYHVSLRGIQII